MPRYSINTELSFLHPQECRVIKKMKGQGFSLVFDDLQKDKETYYVKWIDARTPKIAWNILQDSKFDKSKGLEPVKRNIKVEGFNLKKLPDFKQIKLSHNEYVSFRGSEYAKDSQGIEWLELTWCRMYCRVEQNTLKIMSVGFLAAGEANCVANRLRAHFMNMINGVSYKTDNVEKWIRVPVSRTIKKPKSKKSSRRKSNQAKFNQIKPDRSKPTQPKFSTDTQTTVSSSSGQAFMKTRQCYSCSGSGVTTCSSCGGSGGRNEQSISYDWNGDTQYDTYWVPCFCSGGQVSCAGCGGSGYVYV